MAVSEVKLSSAGVSGSVSAGDSQTINLGGSYRARYFVKCSTSNDTPDIIFRYFHRTTSLPYIGRSFKIGNGFDRFSVCRSLDVNYTDKSDGQFVVDARFEPLQVEVEQPDVNGQPTSNPFQWADEIEVTFSQYSVPVEQAEFRGFSHGANRRFRVGAVIPVMNSAMIPFDPPLEKEENIKIIRITKIAATYDGFSFDRFNNTINGERVIISKPVYGFRQEIPPYKGKLKMIGGQFQIQNGVRFWRQTAEIHINGFTWIKEVQDRGMDELYFSGERMHSGATVNAANAPKGYLHVPIRDSGHPITEPVLLNGLGKRANPNGPPVYSRWNVHPIVSWAPIHW